MSNTILILIILLCILFLLYLYITKISKKNKNNNIESFLNNNYDKNNIHNNINNNSYEKNNDENNLLINGSFNNGKNSKNFINQDGYNKIIKMKNPTISNYVLEQRKSDSTFYELSIKGNINSAYLLYFWVKLEANLLL